MALSARWLTVCDGSHHQRIGIHICIELGLHDTDRQTMHRRSDRLSFLRTTRPWSVQRCGPCRRQEPVTVAGLHRSAQGAALDSGASLRVLRPYRFPNKLFTKRQQSAEARQVAQTIMFVVVALVSLAPQCMTLTLEERPYLAA